MTPVEVIAASALSPLGEGAAAWDPEASASCVRLDAGLEGARLRKPFAARVDLAARDTEDRAAALLVRAVRKLRLQLDDCLVGWNEERVGLAIGTSGGGMSSLTRLATGENFTRELALGAFYFGPLAPAMKELGVEPEPLTQVLAACASSTFAIGIGARWLELGLADLVIAGGYDALSPFIAAGFECLGATSRRPMPFRRARDGLCLGEGAALLALARPGRVDRSRVLGRVLGFGASSDAVHATAPDRTGKGVIRAGRAALRDAGRSPSDIQLLSAHGTATSFNDAAEALAMGEIFGEAAASVVCHPFKAVIGHTLGAAGALESLAALTAIERRILPAALGEGEPTPELTLRLLERAEPGEVSATLKLSSAFGGANAALVLGDAESTSPPTPTHAVGIVCVGSPIVEVDPDEIAERLGIEASRVSRLDPVSLLALGAASRLGQRPSKDSGVVFGSIASTLELDAAFERRRLERGAEPRHFPATSPNLAPGNCCIALGLVGPSLSVGAGPGAPLEALLVGRDLVASGDAPEVLVIVGDHVGPFVQQVLAAAGLVAPPYGAVAVLLGRGGTPLERAGVSALARTGGLPGGEAGWPLLLSALGRLGLLGGDLPA